MNHVSINLELFELNAYLPAKLSLLSKSDPAKALELLQHWGDTTKSTKVVYAETVAALDAIGDQPKSS